MGPARPCAACVTSPSAQRGSAVSSLHSKFRYACLNRVFRCSNPTFDAARLTRIPLPASVSYSARASLTRRLSQSDLVADLATIFHVTSRRCSVLFASTQTLYSASTAPTQTLRRRWKRRQ